VIAFISWGTSLRLEFSNVLLCLNPREDLEHEEDKRRQGREDYTPHVFIHQPLRENDRAIHLEAGHIFLDEHISTDVSSEAAEPHADHGKSGKVPDAEQNAAHEVHDAPSVDGCFCIPKRCVHGFSCGKT